MEITQEQKYEILRNEIQKGMGLDQIVKLGLEILMNTEREEHTARRATTATAIATGRCTDAALLLLSNVAMNVEAYNYPVTTFRFENEKFKWDIA